MLSIARNIQHDVSTLVDSFDQSVDSLAHLYNLVSGLKMYDPDPPPVTGTGRHSAQGRQEPYKPADPQRRELKK